MAKTVLLGKAPLTTIRHIGGTRSNLPAGAVAPASIDPTDAKRLIAEGYLEEVELVDDEIELEGSEELETTEGDFELITGGIDAIMADVGSDAELAQAYLARETGEQGEKRSTLITKLEAVIAASKA
jgi:hypothetical protein